MTKTITAPIGLVLFLCSGCFTSQQPQSYTCASDKDCPPGWLCGADGKCAKPLTPGSDATSDARSDVPQSGDLRTDGRTDRMMGGDGACAGTPTSCGAPGSCIDCTKGVAGQKCLLGVCGCTDQNDCAAGQACVGGKCSTTCPNQEKCQGGCCAAGLCGPGDKPTQCGSAAACVDCTTSAQGHTCVSGSCGCLSSGDCPGGKACDLKTHTCGATCDTNDPCNGGCCSGAVGGTCTAGTSDGACGNNGASCADCTANSNGHKCIGGQCGCSGAADCPAGASGCTNNLCINKCSTSVPCSSGCCNATTNGTCQLGTAASACGSNGQCVDCTSNSSGHACVSGSCGCNSAADCPSGKACDTATHKCTNACGATQPCNGACCSGAVCTTTQSSSACGSSGVCANCATSASGHLCISGSCGCNSSADCPQFTACNTTTHLCSTSCAGGLTCNGGCCDGTNTCTNGSANSACGSSGGPCTACAGGSTCTSGLCKKNNGSTCTANNQCGSGNCVDGYCCSSACSGKCQACDISGSLGTCSTVPSGQPHGSRGACSGSGTCQGTCNGSSATACTYPISQCRAPSCSGSTMTLAASCDGAGNCPALQTQSCGNYSCSGTACATSCTYQSACASSAWCCTACPSWCVCNTCYPKRADGLGCDAGASYQCVSNLCSHFYKDSDGDGYGGKDPASSSYFCGSAPPAGWVTNNNDCCDSDPDAKPGQTGWYTTANACGTFDYDCNGTAEKHHPSGFQGCTFTNWCASHYGYPCNTSGFVAGWGTQTANYVFAPASAPACGVNGTFIQVCWTASTIYPCGYQVYCDFGNISNTRPPLTRAQECH